MSRSMSFNPRRRNLWVAAAALAGGLIFFVAGAFADAGNPILGSIRASAVDNGNGTVTIFVRGQWNWLSHGNNDCNVDRNGAGVGIIWSDRNGADNTRTITTATRNGTTVTITTSSAQTFGVGDSITVAGVSGGTGFNGTFTVTAQSNTTLKYTSAGAGTGSGGTVTDNDVFNGFKVTKAPLTVYVGTQTATAGLAVNPVDEMAHPADRGNVPEGYDQAGDFPAGQQFVDPAPPDPALFAAWRGGCGRLPLAATAPKGNHPEKINQPCADTTTADGDPVGSTACADRPWGSWGYEKSDGLGHFGYSHTYLKTLPNGQSGLPDRVCVNFYDVHGNNAGLQAPKSATEITVDGNGDNSVETNAFDVTNGANCIKVANTSTSTEIRNGAGTVVTAVEVGTTVHDFITVTSPGNPTPKGDVVLKWFTNGTCTAPAQSSTTVTLNANGEFDATAFAKTPAVAGKYAFQAQYLGDNNFFLPSTGPCEPLSVVDANIQITPASATNAVGTNHTLTGHVNVNDGTGSVNAPAGTTINFAIVNGPGGFAGPSSCTTIGLTGSCTVAITSSTTGTSTIRASTDVRVAGVLLHRASGDGKGLDSADASKAWANAKIDIAPSATNEIGKSHTFTVTLSKDTGTGTYVAALGEHVTVTLTDTNGATHSTPTGTCTNSGVNTDANGQCTITFTSNAAGKVTAHASSTLNINGAMITVQTSGAAQNSADAVKTFVDANIQLTPASAINPVSTNHVLTAHVNVNTGSGSFGNAPDGTQISFTIDSGPGSLTTANPCTTAGDTGSCTITLTSATPGTTIVSAHVTLSVGGVSLTRNTNAAASNSGPAAKLFADDTARTDILDAANNVVTTVVAGTIVHDKVFVAKTAGTPAGVPDPTGNVVFHRYTTIDCTGTATNQTVSLTAGSPSTAVSDAFASVGNVSYSAEYLGDANYPARTGACEPLTVTPVPAPAIAIVKNPKSQTVARGGSATFTITVTNVGNTVLTDVNVVDPLSPNCNRTKADIPALASMAPGASVTYTCTRPNTTAGFDNVATATGTPPTGPNVSASDTAPVKVQALTPAKKVVAKKKKKPKVVSHKKPKATG